MYIPNMIASFNGIPELQEIYNKYQFVIEQLYGKSYQKLNDEIKQEQKKETRSILGMMRAVQQKRELEMLAKMIGAVIKQGKQEEIEMEVKDLAKGEPIEYYKAGSYSVVFVTNDKIFKLGIERQKFEIKRFHRRFVYPILRKRYEDGENTLYIEAYERHYEDPNITEEELLMVYEELYRDGFRWEDARKPNLVRLKKDNELPSYIRQKDDTKFGFQEDEDKHIALKKGELAVCDLDYIYHKDERDYQEGKYQKKSDQFVIEHEKKLIEQEERGKEL